MANSVEPNQKLLSAASDLGLHCLQAYLSLYLDLLRYLLTT